MIDVLRRQAEWIAIGENDLEQLPRLLTAPQRSKGIDIPEYADKVCPAAIVRSSQGPASGLSNATIARLPRRSSCSNSAISLERISLWSKKI
ncbi:MAG: hypothetical protein FD153_1837 [Rhodospirillaceae bacterium]|nr:MAG: hypothetical protein FD153_1837 [Rhodospirillaceae bacterium]